MDPTPMPGTIARAQPLGRSGRVVAIVAFNLDPFVFEDQKTVRHLLGSLAMWARNGKLIWFNPVVNGLALEQNVILKFFQFPFGDGVEGLLTLAGVQIQFGPWVQFRKREFVGPGSGFESPGPSANGARFGQAGQKHVDVLDLV